MPGLLDLGPLAQLRAGRLRRRLVQMIVGLVLYGVSLGLMVRGALGLAPWDVLHAGAALHVPLTIGQVLTLVSFVVLLAWIPLRERPGIATLANPVVIGLSADATIALLDGVGDFDPLILRSLLVVGGVLLCGFASALYIGAQLGRGPRDGLMTGLARRTGRSLRVVRTGIELVVVVIGVGLAALAGGVGAGIGSVLGVGSVLFALAIGPLTQAMLPRWIVEVSAPVARVRTRRQRRVATTAEASAATMTSTAVNRSSVSHSSRSVSTRP